MTLKELGQHKQELMINSGRRALFSYQVLCAVYLPPTDSDGMRIFIQKDLARAPSAIARHVKEWCASFDMKLQDTEPRSVHELERIMEAGLRA